MGLIDKTYPPKLSSGIRVERVDTVSFRRYVHDVVNRTANGHVRDVERLRIDKSIYRRGKKLSESIHLNVSRSERDLVQILPGAPVIIVLRQDSRKIRLGLGNRQVRRSYDSVQRGLYRSGSGERAVTKPVELIVAATVLEELHVAEFVTLALDELSNSAVAVN